MLCKVVEGESNRKAYLERILAIKLNSLFVPQATAYRRPSSLVSAHYWRAESFGFKFFRIGQKRALPVICVSPFATSLPPAKVRAFVDFVLAQRRAIDFWGESNPPVTQSWWPAP